MVRIVWSPYAVDDLEVICHNITKDSEHYARLFAQGVINAIERLEIFQNYRIIYQTKPDAIEILAIMHGMRLIRNY